MITRTRIVHLVGGALAAIALLSLMGAVVGGFPSRPRFQAVGVGVVAPATGSLQTSGAVLVGTNLTAGGATFSGDATFNGRVDVSNAANPRVHWIETGASVDNERWRAIATGESWLLQTLNDAEGAAGTAIAIDRTGTTVDSITMGAPTTLAVGAAINVLDINNAHASGPNVRLQRSGSTFGDIGNGGQMGGTFTLDALAFVARAGNPIQMAANGSTTPHFAITTGGLVQAGGVNITPVRAFKAADTSTSSDATVNADPDLVLAVAASSVRYKLEGFFKVSSASATPGFRLSCTVPSGTAAQFVVHLSNGAGAAQQDTNISCGQNDFTLAAGDRAMLQISGEILTSITAGNLVIAWSQSVSNATATILEQGSWLEITRMN